MNTKQNRNGLPDAFLDEKRFFELPTDKKEILPDDWNNPEKWEYIDDIPEEKYFGFAVGNNTNYLFIDGDHVIDPKTGKLIPWAQKIYDRLRAVCITYEEDSQSGTGFHMFADLGEYADNFAMESNGYNQIIVAMDPEEYRALPKEKKAKVPKIEFFYHSQGRYAFLTGKHKELIQLAKNEDAAALFTELLEIRKEHHEKYAKKTYLEDSAKIEIDDATRKRVLEALPYISANDREIWVRVGLALNNCGFPFEVWDEWSQFTDQRTGEICDKYSPEETPKIWKSFQNTKSYWNAGTIIKLAKGNGFQTGTTEADPDRKPEKRSSLRLDEYSDVAQAELFCDEYGDVVRYSKATRFLKYSGSVWEESDLKAQRLAQVLTDRQLKEARALIWSARKKMDKEIEKDNPDNAIMAAQKAALKAAEQIRKDVIKRRTSQRIMATLTEAAPRLEVDTKLLDHDGFLLNTPGGTVDLRTGQMRAHDPEDYCTKMTTVAPGAEGAEVFNEFLDQITCNDADLKRYLQEISGEFAIGEVKREELFIVTGEGGNGKSTFFNLLFKVFGDYAGMLSSDVLITGSRKNKSPELAELRGKRMILAAELDEGTRLDAGIVKRLASTDPIRAEKKFKDPFDFIPSHSVILYTNHLPRVGARDSGTWDRLRVIPFNARFRNTQNEIKDYASVLFDQCGGAVLSWIIEGARRFIENGFKIEQPECVKQAIEEYRKENDWLSAFLEERCLVSFQYREAAGELYRNYRLYCSSMGDFARSSAEFKKALEGVGIEHKKTKAGMIYRGVRLKDAFELAQDQSRATKEA